jgi:hypothetical protein
MIYVYAIIPDRVAVSCEKSHWACAPRSRMFIPVQCGSLKSGLYPVAVAQSSQALSQSDVGTHSSPETAWYRHKKWREGGKMGTALKDKQDPTDSA